MTITAHVVLVRLTSLRNHETRQTEWHTHELSLFNLFLTFLTQLEKNAIVFTEKLKYWFIGVLYVMIGSKLYFQKQFDYLKTHY